MTFNVEKIVNQSKEKRERIGKNIDEAFDNKRYIQVPHENLILSFQHPAFRGTYGNVADQIDLAGLKRPNSSEIASIVYDALQNKEIPYESEIIDILNGRYFWEFTGNLYLPKSNDEVNNGIILANNPEIINGKLNIDKNSLVERLQNNDEDVKFVPFGFKLGEQTWQELEKNPYIIARYGREGAEKVSKVASNYSKNPRIWAFDSVDKEEARMSSLGAVWHFGGLYVCCNVWADNDGDAFGIS